MKRAICIKNGGNWVQEGIRHRRYIPEDDARNRDRERERKGEARLRMITREGRAIRYRKCTLCRLRNSRPAHISIQIAIRAGPYLAAIPLNRLPRSNLAPSFFSPRNFLLLVFSLPLAFLLVARTSLVFLVFWTFLGARRDSFFVSSKILD